MNTFKTYPVSSRMIAELVCYPRAIPLSPLELYNMTGRCRIEGVVSRVSRVSSLSRASGR